MNTRRKRQQNWFSKMATELYYDLVQIQKDKMEEYCKGYDADEKFFYATVEPRVLFKDVLIMLKGTTKDQYTGA